MGQTIQCPHCGQTYALTAEQVPQYSGQTIACTRCQKQFTVPQLGPEGAPPPPITTEPVPGATPAPTDISPYPGAAQPIPYGGYAPYGAAQETNGLAIASLVLGILGLFVPIIFGLLAIVLGIVALNRTKDPRVGGKGLAIAGISVGGAGLLLNVCAISILLPSLTLARETAKRVKCASNMRQIGQAILLYSNDYRGVYPATLDQLILTQDITAEVFTCPSSDDTPAPGGTPQQQTQNLHTGGHLSYVYIGMGLTNSVGADTVVLYEPMTNHDNDGINILWGDGHVSFHSRQEAQQIINDVEAGKNPPSSQ